MWKKIKIFAVTSALIAATAIPASAFSGGFKFNSGGGRSERVSLGDSSDGTYLHLRGTSRYCVSRGNSYAHMRQVMRGERYVNWWIDKECTDGVIRVCIESPDGNYFGCSSYRDFGWHNYKH